MPRRWVYVLLFTSLLLLGGIYLFAVYTKIKFLYKNKKYMRLKKSVLKEFAFALELLRNSNQNQTSEMSRLHKERLKRKCKKKKYRMLFEEVVLEYLENEENEKRCEIRTMANDIGLPKYRLKRKKRNIASIVYECRRAGLYQYSRAVPFVMSFLDIISGEVQFQVLMALSRIGDVEAVCKTFDIIQDFILVNPRAVCEIMSVFTGDTLALYRQMIAHKEEYVASLFLKAINEEEAGELAEEITAALKYENEDMRKAKELTDEIAALLDNQGDKMKVARILTQDISSLVQTVGKEKKVAAVKAIGKIRRSDSGESVIQTLKDCEWEVRAVSASVLGHLRFQAAGYELSEAVCDVNWWVRRNAAEAILSMPENSDFILGILKKKDRYARESMLAAIENAGREEEFADIFQLDTTLEPA